jgi:RNA polymerase sigma factor (TIGR02999 family)
MKFAEVDMSHCPSDVTRMLSQIEQGDPAAAEQLLPLIYDELRKLAAAKLAQEKQGQTLQATALVHEAYLRLVGGKASADWNGRGHFFAAAAEAMRRILIENARRKSRVKHGGGLARVELNEADVVSHLEPDELLALDEAMSRLAVEDAAKAKLVELRYFAGLSNEEAAEFLGISTATAKRHWRYAKAWLHRAIAGGVESTAARPDSSEARGPP